MARRDGVTQALTKLIFDAVDDDEALILALGRFVEAEAELNRGTKRKWGGSAPHRRSVPFR